MSYPHFYLEHQILADETGDSILLELSADDAKHAKVLRLKPGEMIAVIDAATDYFICELTDVSRTGITVRIASKEAGERAHPSITLFQGLSKGERFEEVLRHSIELGIDRFVPLLSERTIVRLDEGKVGQKVARWQAIAKSAAMQSGRRSIPNVTDPLPFEQLVEEAAGFDAVFLFYEEADGKQTLREIMNDVLKRAAGEQPKVAVVIGPEGGFSSEEVHSLAVKPNVHVLSLGDTILRTETAGLVATALVAYELGGLGNTAADR